MKKYLYLSIGIIIIILTLAVTGLSLKVRKLNGEVSTYDNNFKALNLENDTLKKEAIAYKFDIEQLEYLNDSIINKLNDTRRQLKIKDKQLKQMQYIKTETINKDTIVFRDTIFKDNFVKIDTTLTSKWHTTRVELQYPSTIKIDTKYTSELSVFAKSSKEIIGTPKKCAIGRWFQKKHKVIRVEVYDANPNSVIKEKKFVIIE